MAPRICKLCKHPRRVAIDKFMQHGHTYKEFTKKFRLRSINVWCWTRHKGHIADTIVETAPSPTPENALLDVKKLGDINRRLQILAQRSEKGGRPANAIQAYSQLAKNLTTLAEYNKEQQRMGSGNAAHPLFYICSKSPADTVRQPNLSEAIAEARASNPEWDALRDKFERLHANVTAEEWGSEGFHEQVAAILEKFEPRTQAIFLQDYVRGIYEQDLRLRVALAYRKRAHQLWELVPFAEVVRPTPPVPVDLDAEQRHVEKADAERLQAEEAEQTEIREERKRRNMPAKSAIDVWNELN